MDQILLSVIIPTYNRYEYLKGCLDATTTLRSNNFEIIVQDNTEDNKEILEYIKKLEDSRIKYFHIKEHICVSDNCDEAMKHATGKYICMIGDDDTICDSMIAAAQFCAENRIEAVKYLIPGFNWPDMTFVGKKKEANLFFREKADGGVEIIDAEEKLINVLLNADGLDFLPRVYHGMVSKACMDRIYLKAGSYFPGPSPDMGNAAAVCLESKKSAFIYDYLIVSGYGYKSARGEGNRQQHYGKLNEKPWLPKDIMERWDHDIPPIFSGETIIADSLTESLCRMGRNDLAKRYNYSSLYAIFLAHHKDALRQMMKFVIKKPIRMMWLIKGIVVRLRVSIKCRLSHNGNPYFMEKFDIVCLEDAQRQVNQLRAELAVNLHLISKECLEDCND